MHLQRNEYIPVTFRYLLRYYRDILDALTTELARVLRIDVDRFYRYKLQPETRRIGWKIVETMARNRLNINLKFVYSVKRFLFVLLAVVQRGTLIFVHPALVIARSISLFLELPNSAFLFAIFKYRPIIVLNMSLYCISGIL